MEVEDHSISLKLEHIFNVQAVHHSLQMDEQFPLLRLGLKLASSDDLIQSSDILPEMPLIDLLGKRGILRAQDCLGFFVEVFYLVFYPRMNAFVENTKDVVFLPDVELDILEIFLPLEQLPELQLF